MILSVFHSVAVTMIACLPSFSFSDCRVTPLQDNPLHSAPKESLRSEVLMSL